MRRRLTGAIVSVVALTVLLLGVPLAIAVDHSYRDSATVVLQRRAAETLAEITLPLDPKQLAGIATEVDTRGPFGIYDANGKKLIGSGPSLGDAAVTDALSGEANSANTPDDFIVAVPITDRSTEQVAGAVRVSEPSSTVHSRIQRAYMLMLLLAIAVLLVAWWVASAQARHFTRPIERLAAQANQIGDGEVVVEHSPSGVAEVDAVGAALTASSIRVVEHLSRERAFSADVSHQLRTPITGLRLRLESAAEVSDPTGAIARALVELDRLEGTVDHLLALSRDALPVPEAIDVSSVIASVRSRWSHRFQHDGRPLDVIDAGEPTVIRATRSAVDQVLDVLIANSLQHGAGTTTVTARRIAGGVSFDVTDEGVGIAAADAEAIFTRGHGSGHGIGLALARTLAEADGGRLLLTSHHPPRFSVLFSVT